MTVRANYTTAKVWILITDGHNIIVLRVMAVILAA